MKSLLKRTLAILVVLAMTVVLVPFSVFATETTTWQAELEAAINDLSYGEGFVGSGTAVDPYQISSALDLAYLAKTVDAGTTYEGKCFQLTTTIDLSGKEFNPIGLFDSTNSTYKAFSGSFDGNGKTIKGLYITKATGGQGSALFAYTSAATIKNLTVTVDAISSDSRAAGIIAESAGALVYNCVVKKSDNAQAAHTISSVNAGGIVGRTANSSTSLTEVIACINEVDITGSAAGGLGGIIGTGINVYVLLCTNKGSISNNVSNAQKAYMGGIIGYTTAHPYEIYLSSNEGTITANYNISDTQVGGIVGYSKVNANLTSCYDVSGAANPMYGKLESGKSSNLTNCAYTGAQVSLTGATSVTANALKGEAAKTTLGLNASATELDSTKMYANYFTFANDQYPTVNIVALNNFYYGFNINDLDGSGTQVDPYIIADAETLVLFATKYVNTGTDCAGMFFKLQKDIDLNNVAWTPIGTSNTHFKGNFDGNNCTIQNLTVSNQAFAGLFAYTNGATIKNLTVSVKSVDTGTATSTRAAAIVAQANAGTTITNCHVTAVNASSYIKGCDAGAIVGRSAATTTITDCTNSVAIMGAGDTSTRNSLGGIVGMAIGAVVTNCKNQGAVTSNKEVENVDNFIGGIIGSASNNACTVKNCLNTGTISITYEGKVNHAAGIVGNARTATKIIACINLGTIVATDIEGAETGDIYGSVKNNAGTVSGSVNSDATLDLYGWQTFTDGGKVRILATLGDVDLSEYDSFGFEIAIYANGKLVGTKVENITTIFESVVASGAPVAANTLDSDGDGNADGDKYIVPVTFTNLSNGTTYTFGITPFYVQGDTTTYCATENFTFPNS